MNETTTTEILTAINELNTNLYNISQELKKINRNTNQKLEYLEYILKTIKKNKKSD